MFRNVSITTSRGAGLTHRLEQIERTHPFRPSLHEWPGQQPLPPKITAINSLPLSSWKSLLIWWQPYQSSPCKGFPFYPVQLCALNPLQSASAKCLGITSRPSFGVHSGVMWKGFTVVSLALDWTPPSSVELIRQRRRPCPGCPGGVAPLVPRCPPVHPASFGVRRSGGWASKGRARHPPLPRPRLQGRILTKAGFLNGPTTWKGTSEDGSSSAMACFHITGKFRGRSVQCFSK